MNRRDLIIVAVLLNAVLLAIFFVMATHTDDDKLKNSPDVTSDLVNRSSSPQPLQESLQASQKNSIAVNQPVARDEIDFVLKDYAVPSQTILPDEETFDELERESFAQISPSFGVSITEQEPEKNQNIIEITIKRGDSLEKIARANATTIDKIKKANHLTSDRLIIGKVLRIPVSEEGKNSKSQKTLTHPVNSKSSPEATQISTATDLEYYIMKSGDNPWKIAKMYRVEFDELLKLNHLDEEKARNLKVGDKIRVR